MITMGASNYGDSKKHYLQQKSFYDISLSSATELFNCIAQLTTQTRNVWKEILTNNSNSVSKL